MLFAERIPRLGSVGGWKGSRRESEVLLRGHRASVRAGKGRCWLISNLLLMK